ncbi:hypothetical protein [uncultured Aquimarina sp.]|uniref:hypothetical protein n=1 Tax=uncultured Aquimarina sp. TaxID=575652 RepID=UPI0026149849|nr:hypothetical protein [uncultured Aquimarina sp.]
MSLPKKGSRRISVDSNEYRWMAKSDGTQINLTIAPIENGTKIRASFDYDTENIGSNAYYNPFIITPYVTREVILFASKKGYLSNSDKTELNLGNLTKKITLNLTGVRKTKKLIKSIENRMNSEGFNSSSKEQIQSILTETNHLIQHGEWFIGFEDMITNLDEIDFKIETDELILIKEIFQKAKVNWTEKWGWIENMVRRKEH